MKRERGWGPLCFDGRTSLYMFWDKGVFLYVFWGTCKCIGGYGEYGGIGKLELDSAYKGRGGLRLTEAPWHVPQNYKVGRHISKLFP